MAGRLNIVPRQRSKRSLWGAKRTSAGAAEVTLLTQCYGPAVRCKENLGELVVSGLASMYPAFDWSVAPGHHGYQRACDLISGISGKASTDHLGHQCSQAPGKTEPPSRFHPLADLGGLESQTKRQAAPRISGHELKRSRQYGLACWRVRSDRQNVAVQPLLRSRARDEPTRRTRT
jgi:hypothetical protein